MSDTPPPLPENISPNGQEIWDWAAKLSEHTHRVHAIRTLSADISGIGNRCGDCDKWMKSRECPRERNVNGWNHGPSCNDYVFSCRSFVEARSATARRARLQDELATLDPVHPLAAKKAAGLDEVGEQGTAKR